MKTHLVVHVNSDGGKASSIVQKLIDLKFDTTLGRYDFIYNWKELGNGTPTTQQVLDLVDKVQESLKGMNVLLHFSTFD